MQELQFHLDGTPIGLAVEADPGCSFAELRNLALDDGLEIQSALFVVNGSTAVPLRQERKLWSKYVRG